MALGGNLQKPDEELGLSSLVAARRRIACLRQPEGGARAVTCEDLTQCDGLGPPVARRCAAGGAGVVLTLERQREHLVQEPALAQGMNPVEVEVARAPGAVVARAAGGVRRRRSGNGRAEHDVPAPPSCLEGSRQDLRGEQPAVLGALGSRAHRWWAAQLDVPEVLAMSREHRVDELRVGADSAQRFGGAARACVKRLIS